jgi:uncharacterized membrane protein
MAYFRRSGGQIALLIFAVLSIGVSIYLTLVHYTTEVTLVCSSGGLVDCERVLTSRYSYVPYTELPVALPGILWSLVAGLLALGAWRIWPRRLLLRIVEVAWAGFGMLTVFYLIYVEIVLLHTICAWCTVVHVLVLLYLLVSLVLLQSSDDDNDEDDRVEEEEASALSSR